MIARYPGHKAGGTGHDDSNLHIDNGKDSLLPMSEDLREDGQRFTFGYSFGRADHVWEGFRHYTHQGKGQPRRPAVIGSLTARQRELWRFPPAGHPY